MPEKKQEIGKKITWGNLYPRYKAGLRTGETSNMYIHTHTHTVYEYEYGYSLDIDTHTHVHSQSHVLKHRVSQLLYSSSDHNPC